MKTDNLIFTKHFIGGIMINFKNNSLMEADSVDGDFCGTSVATFSHLRTIEVIARILQRERFLGFIE